MKTEYLMHTFGDFTLNLHTGTVSGPAGDIVLRPKAFALLTHLAKNLGRVVPKDELLDAVWPDVYVQEGSLTQAVRELRRELGDSGTLLRNVSGRGYILAGGAGIAEHEQPKGPVVAVLRFRNDNEAATEDFIVDGFAEDVVSGLARFGTLTVIARSSSFQFASFAGLDDRQAAEKLGADYLVEGAVSRRSEVAIITVGLSDARTQSRLWGERYEAKGVELFAVQREIASQIVNRLVRRVGEATLVRSQSALPRSLTVYDLVVRAAAVLEHFDTQDPARALGHLDEALERDPDYAPAHAYRALAIAMQGGMGLAAPTVLTEALAQATRAVVLAPDNATAYRILATIELYRRQYDAAEASLRTSLEINASDADTVGLMGHLLILRGRPLEGGAWLDRAALLNPVQHKWYNFSRALGAYQLGEYTESLRLLRQLPENAPHIASLAVAAAAKAERPSSEVKELAMALDDDEAIGDFVSWEHEADRAHIREGQRLAREIMSR